MDTPKEDFSAIDLGDKRLNKRLLSSIEDMSKKSKESILSSGKDRNSSKRILSIIKQ